MTLHYIHYNTKRICNECSTNICVRVVFVATSHSHAFLRLACAVKLRCMLPNASPSSTRLLSSVCHKIRSPSPSCQVAAPSSPNDQLLGVSSLGTHGSLLLKNVNVGILSQLIETKRAQCVSALPLEKYASCIEGSCRARVSALLCECRGLTPIFQPLRPKTSQGTKTWSIVSHIMPVGHFGHSSYNAKQIQCC